MPSILLMTEPAAWPAAWLADGHRGVEGQLQFPNAWLCGCQRSEGNVEVVDTDASIERANIAAALRIPTTEGCGMPRARSPPTNGGKTCRL